ncbi:MAG: IS3 family transposase, partial [Desulfotomaculum sp.]|nr:IS3 family transposase [Desulfotomaculum sp.]
MKCRFIREHMDEFHVERMCQVLKVSRSTYYAWCKRSKSQRSQQDAAILEKIKVIHKKSRGTYGSPRIHQQLRQQGIHCGKKRVERIMRSAGIRAIQRRRYKATTNSEHTMPVAENKLARRFNTPAPNHVWVADITYIPTGEGWLYLAVVMDLYSRKIVGWSMDERMSVNLTEQALKMAIYQRKPSAGLIHHSDRGSQYASRAYQQLLWRHGMICSMSRKGNCWDNAVMESFFHTLKAELVNHQQYKTRAQARR